MSENSNRQDKSGTPDHGPTEAPPNLPRGWIAQWDAKAGKYYFVQLSTSHAQWELPTEPAPGVDTPSSTPMSGGNSQFSRPLGSPDQSKISSENSRSPGADGGNEGERGFGSMAVNMLASKQPQSSHQGGLTGLAQSFLGSQGSHSASHQSSGGGTGAFAASLISNAFSSGSKPHNKPTSGSQPTSGFDNSVSSYNSGHSGTGNLLGGLFTGHASHNHHQQYGYSSGTSPAGGYSGTAPSAQYQPSVPSQQTYGTSNETYNPSGYHNQNDQHTALSQSSGKYPGNQSVHHYGVQRPDDPSKPFYVGGTPFDDHEQGYANTQQSQSATGGSTQGPQGSYQSNQYGISQPYGGPASGVYNTHPPPHRTAQFGQTGPYVTANQQYPPPSQGGYGGVPHGGGYGNNPRY